MLYDQHERPIETTHAPPSGVTDVSSFGQLMSEVDIKKGLRELNPGLHFDMGGNLNLTHPRIDEWQGVFYNGHHVCSLQRGVCPEYDVYALDKFGERNRILKVGWRGTLELMVRKRIPGITWDALCAKFDIEKKWFKEHSSTLAAGAV